MNWFCKQPPIAYCQECGLAYKKDEYGLFREFCSVHRPARVARQQRICDVTWWAEHNWERLEKQMLEEELKNHDAQMAERQNSLMNRPPTTPYWDSVMNKGAK